MTTITLPPLHIKAYAPDFGIPTHKPGLPPPYSPVVVAKAHEQRANEYANGHGLDLIKHLLETSTKNHFKKYRTIDPLLGGDLVIAHKADQLICLSPQLTAAQAWSNASSGDRLRFKTTVTPADDQLSGGALTPIKALANALFGDGRSLRIDLENVGIRPRPENLPSLRQAIEQAPIGSSRIVLEKAAYNTFADGWGVGFYLGNITLKVEVNLHKASSTSFSYQGSARAYNDIFDAHPSSHRDFLREAATAVLAGLMAQHDGKSYEIKINGSIPLNYQSP